MATIPQTTSTEQHVLAFDQALRDARAQLPRTADERRADKGLLLALNRQVTLASTTVAHVTSARDPEVVYQVHSRVGCDCPDSVRRRAQQPDAAPGQTGCKHWYAGVLTAMATLTLAIKGYAPEAETVWYPAVSLEEPWYGHRGYATDLGPEGWWFCFADWSGGFSTEVTSLELWNREPVHAITWRETVRSWDRWLSAREGRARHVIQSIRVPQQRLAEQFGSSRAHVGLIHQRRTWTHLPEEDGEE